MYSTAAGYNGVYFVIHSIDWTPVSDFDSTQSTWITHTSWFPSLSWNMSTIGQDVVDVHNLFLVSGRQSEWHSSELFSVCRITAGLVLAASRNAVKWSQMESNGVSFLLGNTNPA
jgi:hypothetical protein